MTPAEILDEVQFWSVQMSEHCGFIAHAFADDSGIKGQAMSHEANWKNFAQGSARLQPDGMVRAAVEFAVPLRMFKQAVLERVQTGNAPPSMWPSMLRHMLMELDMFTAKLEGTLSPHEEIFLWLVHSVEESEFAAHLLDIDERQLVQQLGLGAGRFHALAAAAKQGVLNLPAAQAEATGFAQWLGASGIGTPKVRSMVPPGLAQHVLREQQRFAQLLARPAPPVSGPAVI